MWTIKRFVSKGEYDYAVVPEHPKAIGHGYVLAHRAIMENHIGRLLTEDEIVHHIDGNKKNNSLDNLEIMSKTEHSRHHRPKQVLIINTCKNCNKEFSRRKGLTNVFCSRRCNGKFQRKNNWNPYKHSVNSVR